MMTSATDASKWCQQRRKLGLTWMTSVRGMRRVTARDLKQRRVEAIERELKCAAVRGRCVGHMISGTEPLSGAWGRVQSPTMLRLSRLCRSAQDDLCGTFKTVIRAIFVAVMKRAMVYAVWNSLTMAAAGSEPKDNYWMTSEVQRRKVAVVVVMAETMLKKESH